MVCRKRTEEGFRDSGPTMLCCMILDMFIALSLLFPIFHKQELTIGGLSQH